MEQYLKNTFFIDHESTPVRAFVASIDWSNCAAPVEKAVRLYYAVRDGFRYNPHRISMQPEDFRASVQVQRPEGHCIDKANILVAAARALGIPARLGFANVTNHIGTEKLEKVLGTTVLVFHGFAELFLENQWVKATPAFNAELCQKLDVAPLEFNGREDSVFQQFSKNGNRFMEYLHYYGSFEDLPFDMMIGEWKKYYPKLFSKPVEQLIISTDL
ncbi:MAG: transglutaminase family protein [Cytophagales bacterium]|nr:transglutaminase family protein [Bernardetiaceae bacterium]MDW8205129.1 transglutaminase family protein [Cytophagales bacterium]